MQSTTQARSVRGTKRNAIILFNTFVLVLTLCFSIPAHAEGRGVRQRVSPVYPELARRMKIGGVVKLEASVNAEGKVVTVKTVSGNRMLSNAAEDAVKQWKFVPCSEESTESIEINFALAQ